MKKIALITGLSVLFLFMLFFPHIVFQSAAEGLLLWFNKVFPTLFPFLVISELLIRTNSLRVFTHLLSPVLCPVFRISEPACFAVFGGFLCGYPMGAKITSSLEENGWISHEESSYLLSFVNNVSPAFFITYVMEQHVRDSRLLGPGLCILFGSPVILSFFFRKYRRPEIQENRQYQKPKESREPLLSALDNSINTAIETIVRIGGYIILFSVASGLLSQLPIDNILWRNAVLPFLEITKGIQIIASSGFLNGEQRFLLIMSLSAFGGICAGFQTLLVMKNTNFSLLPYFIKKLATAAVTSFLTFLYFCFV